MTLLYFPRVDDSTSNPKNHAFSFGGSILIAPESAHLGMSKFFTTCSCSCLFVERVVGEVFLGKFPESDEDGIGLGDQLVETKLADLEPSFRIRHGSHSYNFGAFLAVRVVPVVHELAFLPPKPSLSHWIASVGYGDCRLALYVGRAFQPNGCF